MEASACWGALMVQIRSVEEGGYFAFTDRELDGPAAAELLLYLRGGGGEADGGACRARFVDLSRLGRWPSVSAEIASAVRLGLRTMRSLTLDGNAIGGAGAVLESWCSAIEAHPGLQHMSLRDTGLNDANVERLAQVLRDHLVLSAVDLGCNRIGDAGAEALAGALTDSRALVELGLDCTDASPEARGTVEALLERNRGRFAGQGGSTGLLRGLRRARADAAAALAHGRARAPAATVARGWSGADGSCAHPVAAEVDIGQGVTVVMPTVPSVDDMLRAEAADDADGVLFEVGVGVTRELALRCEASWRYSASDYEALRDMQQLIGRLKADRRLERDRTDEAHRRIAESQAAFRTRAAPVEGRVAAIRAALAGLAEAAESAAAEKVRLHRTLTSAQTAFEDARQEREIAAANAQQLVLSHKVRHREVAEEAQALQLEIELASQEAARVERDNEHCRRLLHAARFETETERIVPHSVVGQPASANAVAADC